MIQVSNSDNQTIKFKFLKNKNQLTIQALQISDNDKIYIGEIAANPNIDFQDIETFIQKGEFKVVLKTSDMMKIKIGPIRIDFVSESVLEVKQLKQTIKGFIQKQNKMESKMLSLQSTIQRMEIKLNQYQAQKSQFFKWSKNLKSPGIEINHKNPKIVTKIVKQTYYQEFCLQMLRFQIWMLKFNKKCEFACLGICLLGKMLKHKFNTKFMKPEQLQHGTYMISGNGYCFSDSHQDFNQVKKSFEFHDGDVVKCEYDPIDCRLRFTKNKTDKFEMPIVVPSQDDEFYPCVKLSEQNSQVQIFHE